MKFPVNPLIPALVALSAAASLAWGQESGPVPSRPRDIEGKWVMELGPGCAGPIEIGPAQNASGANWTAVLTATCDNLPRTGHYSIWADANGTYHFSGTVTFGDASVVNSYFDMYWTRDGKALAGAGGNGGGHVMHK